MTDTRTTRDRDIDLLDLLLGFAENLRLLIFLPLGACSLRLASLFYPTDLYSGHPYLPPAQQQSSSTVLAAQVGSLAGLLAGTGALKNRRINTSRF
jgi:hypothetical protein